MDTMISTVLKNRAFTLIEAIMSSLIVGIGTLAIVASLRYGDFAALRARIDARGSQEFAKQSQWVVNYPSSTFRQKLSSGVTLPFTEYSNETPLVLIPQKSPFLLPNKDSYVFKTKMTVNPPPPGEDAYVIDLETEWETPSATMSVSAVRTNKLEMRGIRKW
jgi:hypothetical protein